MSPSGSPCGSLRTILSAATLLSKEIVVLLPVRPLQQYPTHQNQFRSGPQGGRHAVLRISCG